VAATITVTAHAPNCYGARAEFREHRGRGYHEGWRHHDHDRMVVIKRRHHDY
jgi:hypothetical protein